MENLAEYLKPTRKGWTLTFVETFDAKNDVWRGCAEVRLNNGSKRKALVTISSDGKRCIMYLNRVHIGGEVDKVTL